MKHFLQLKLLLLLICLQGHSIAQKTKPVPRWRLQVTAGSSFNYFTDEQPHTGINVGLTSHLQLNYALPKHFSLFAETGYAGTGGTLTSFKDDTWLGFPSTITFQNVKQSSYIIHSLESSVGAAYSFDVKGSWSVKVYVAPTLNVTLSEWESYEKTGNLLTTIADSRGVIGTISGNQYVDKFEPYWWGVTGGLQFNLPIKKLQAWVLDFRFVNGLSPVLFNYSYIGTQGIQGNLRTNSFRVGLGYSIPAFGKKTKHKK
jgi:hypothetical protein